MQARNNLCLRHESYDAWRELHCTVAKALNAINDPSTSAELFSEYQALMEAPEVQQTLHDIRSLQQ
jgi:hypothetical protein